MTIYLNGKFLTQKITGVQRYAREVIKTIDNMNLKDEIILLIPQNAINDMELKNIKTKKIGKLRGRLWEQISLPIFVKKQKSKTLLNLCNIAPVLLPGYITLHDISFKTNSQHLNWKFVTYYKIITRLNIKRYKHIFTVSEFSKSEIINNYHIDENKVTVAYNSAEHINSVVADYEIIKKLELENKEFLFSLGSKSPHKNFKFVEKCAKNNPDLLFVVSGDNNSKIFNDEEENNEIKNIIYTGRLDDGEIKALYARCKAFMFPSKYEGFGIPPLEAIECGCRNIIVSDIPVLHEIYSENVKYLNLNDEENESKKIKDKINEKIIVDESIIKKYTWENTAETIINNVAEAK